MKKTKIICTMGPATDQEGIMEQLIEAGMNVARFNFSHGSYEEQGNRMERFRKARAACDKPIAMLLDTKGPEIRVKSFKNGKITLHQNQEFILTGNEVEGDDSKVSITYPELYNDVTVGSTILLDDGLIELTVQKIEGKNIHCIVRNEATLSDHKGINVPDIHINMPYLSDKDKQDILFGIKNEVDFIAASFTRNKNDIRQMRTFLKENGGEGINIIAKIENKEGVDKIDEIIDAADAIMIARGDMGVELPVEEVPVIQKMIIKKAYSAGKQVIIATQMLDSMMKNPRPTRAEATDVANAIYDGTSAIMLSGETAAGKYPVEAVETMVRIAERTEQDVDYRKRFFSAPRKENPDITDAIGHATCMTAYDLGAKSIVTVTVSGRSARMISRYRPGCTIIAGTMSERVSRQMNLIWGVFPILLKEQKKTVFELMDYAIANAEEKEYLTKGDLVVMTAGDPLGISGKTNMLKVETVW